MAESLDDRRKSLEEQFFKKHDAELVQKLKDAAAKDASKAELRRLTGITDEKVLDALAALGIGGAASLVMSLFPVIAVAWADGKVEDAERTALLDASKSIGVEHGSPAFEYLSKWVAEKPEQAWFELWRDYVKALCAHLKPDDRAMLKASVLGRCRTMAEVSGGFLGLAFRVSDAEKRVIAQVEAAFD